MVSPYLIKKKDQHLSVSQSVRKLFQVIYKKKQVDAEGDKEGDDKIVVSDLISKMSFYYEKIRNYVDYNEENLHRKNAVFRIFKRLTRVGGPLSIEKSEEVSWRILRELIRAGYLPNNKIHESKVGEINEVLIKHIKLRKLVCYRLKQGDASGEFSEKEKKETKNWLDGIMASEVESVLEKDRAKEMMVGNIYESLVENIKLPVNFSGFEKDLKIQAYLSAHRSFLKFDDEMLSFILFKYFNSSWWMPNDEDIETIAANIKYLRKAVNGQLKHSLSKQLDKIAKRYSVYYSVLSDMIAKDPAGLYQIIKEKPASFSGLIKDAFAERFNNAKAKLWRSGINSIMYVILTKLFFTFALEAPAMKRFSNGIDPVSLTANILFPAFLLFLAIIFTKISLEDNAQKVVEGVEEIVFEEKKRTEPIVLRKPYKRGVITNTIFGFLYFGTYFVSFGAIIWVLRKINFSQISIFVFLLFLAFISFLSIRIRKGVRQLVVVEEKDDLLTFLADFFFIPIVGAGKWLSAKFYKLNVFVFVLDFVIEAPFKVFVEIAEQWSRYVKERREDIE